MKVQIIYPEDQWILNKLALYLIENIDYVTGMPNHPDRQQEWDIAYYINYALFKPDYSLVKPFGSTKNSRLTGAFFTHKENKKYYKRAFQVDFCISPCKTSMLLAKKFNRNAFVIYHGLDLDTYKPLIRLGFVGKLCTNGRKGESLFPLIRNLPFVDLKITGGKIPEKQMPDFYQNLDAVLITSTVEGGPMCFQEGLASGKEIIATDVGMVSDFKHHNGIYIFDATKPETLVAILTNLYEKKLARRKIIERFTIDYFVSEHEKIFRKMDHR